jgi:nucleoside-diphosphate-sugar epimerase
MRVLLTGGGGYIGGAVLPALLAKGRAVVALARSDGSAAGLARAGATPVRGELSNAARWLPGLDIDGVIHCADSFGPEMAAADAAFTDALAAHAPAKAVRTGGCWLYGPSGDAPIREGDPLRPPAAFAWMADGINAWRDRLPASAVVHPAMVWDEAGGVFARWIEAARAGRAPVVYGPMTTRWPLVHRDDLARLYVAALDRATPGACLNGVAEEGVAIGEIAATIASAHGAPAPVARPVAEAVETLGDWAACLAWDQRMAAGAAAAALRWTPERKGAVAALSRTAAAVD